MITEEQIIQKIRDIDAVLMTLRGKYHKQKPVREELAQHLHQAFQINPQLMVDLFWKYFEKPGDRSKLPDYSRPPYCIYIFSAITHTQNPHAIKLACQLLVHPKPTFQEASVSFLYDIKDPVVVPYLLKILASDDYDLVSKAAAALGNIGDPRAEPHLLALVDQYDTDETYREDRIEDEDSIIRFNAFCALCLLNTPEARKKILQSVFHDRDIAVQQRGIRYLVAEMPTEAAPYLAKLTNHSNMRIATMAKEYLKGLNPDN